MFAANHAASDASDLFRLPMLSSAGPFWCSGGGRAGRPQDRPNIFALLALCCEAATLPSRAMTHGKSIRWRLYRVECTGSLPTSEAKQRRARLALGWGTARQDLRVLPAFCSACFVPRGCDTAKLRDNSWKECPLPNIPRRMHWICSGFRS